ncbi:MAG: hypothetical protein HUU06_05585 [Planctomycetaceae bacterium]|nr:DUF1570 domain-containing protein [Planctomycetota bacterium]NUN52245.1 hypothetical protein [Planctomycetaceae bacterium]
MRIGIPVAAAVALGLALAAARPAPADEVKMKDGRVLEGRVLSETASEVTLRLRFGGDVTLKRTEIASLERKDLPEEAIAKRRAALDPKDAEGLWKLALEAKALKLRRQHEALLAEVLAADPDHAGAREARGDVLHGGKWMTPAERDRALKDEEVRARAKEGLVEHGGRWVTPEEKAALERGLVLHDGRWMSEREAMTAKGMVEYRGAWVSKDEAESLRLRDALAEAAGVPLTVARSERFSVATVYPQADTDQVLKDAEKAYAEFSGLFGVKPEDRLFDDPFNRKRRPLTIVILEKDSQYQKFLEGLLRIHEDLRKVLRPERVELMKTQKGFYLVDPDCWIVGYQFPFPKEQTRHTVVHKLSHVMLLRWHFKGASWPNWWIVEGLGEVQEINAFGSCQVFCITTGYGEPAADGKWIGESWKAEAKRLVASSGDLRFRDLVTRSLNDLSPHDLVKSWSLVHYLLSLDREKFAKLVLLLKDRMPASEAVPQVYGASLDDIDARWRDFVRKTY